MIEMKQNGKLSWIISMDVIKRESRTQHLTMALEMILGTIPSVEHKKDDIKEKLETAKI